MDYYTIFTDALSEGRIDNLKKVKELNKQINKLINEMPKLDNQNPMLWKAVDNLRAQITKLMN